MAKIVFVRAHNTKKWLVRLSTDVDLADEEIVKPYKRRWDIEVSLKISKSYLRLAKEFQSRSYDALVAHTTIVFARYIMLELARRSGKDPKTLGTLFHAGCGELRQASFPEAITRVAEFPAAASQGVPRQNQNYCSRKFCNLVKSPRSRDQFLRNTHHNTHCWLVTEIG